MSSSKAPKPPHVLDEDEFTDSLHFIIQRDYYPLPSSSSSSSSSSAVAAAALTSSNSSSAALARPLETSRGGTNADAIFAGDGASASSSAGLGAFLASFVSEDTAEFEALRAKEDEERREEMRRVYARRPHREEERRREEEERRRRRREEVYRITAGVREEEEEEVAEVEEEVGGVVRRVGAPDSWKHKVRNALMFVPEQSQGAKEVEERRMLEGVGEVKRKEKMPRVVPAATRLPERFEKEALEHASRVVAAEEAARVAADAASTPVIRGYKLERTPVAEPAREDRIEEGAVAVPMTWGVVPRTPQHVDGPAFQVAQTPRREALAWQLQRKHEKRARTRRPRRPMSSRFTHPSSSLASQLRAQYSGTPVGATPMRTPSRLPTPLHTPIAVVRKKRKAKRKAVSSGPSSLTDDLLNLPGPTTRDTKKKHKS